MGVSKSQNRQISEQHGHKPGQNPRDVDQDRGSFEPGSRKPSHADVDETTSERQPDENGEGPGPAEGRTDNEAGG